MKCAAGKPWVLTVIWLPFDTHRSPEHCSPLRTAMVSQQDNVPCHTAKTTQNWNVEHDRVQGANLASKCPRSHYDCASAGCARTRQIHGGLTLQHAGFATNALVPDTTGPFLRSCVHALMGKRQVQSTLEPPWIEQYQSGIHMNTRRQCFQEKNGTATRWSILFTSRQWLKFVADRCI